VSARRSSPPFASPALHNSGPTRTPVAARRAELRNGPIQHHPSRCDHAARAPWHAIAVDSIVVLVAVLTARAIPPAQIPIAQRRS